jgi:hypothetical protein
MWLVCPGALFIVAGAGSTELRTINLAREPPGVNTGFSPRGPYSGRPAEPGERNAPSGSSARRCGAIEEDGDIASRMLFEGTDGGGLWAPSTTPRNTGASCVCVCGGARSANSAILANSSAARAASSAAVEEKPVETLLGSCPTASPCRRSGKPPLLLAAGALCFVVVVVVVVVIVVVAIFLPCETPTNASEGRDALRTGDNVGVAVCPTKLKVAWSMSSSNRASPPEFPLSRGERR